MKRYIPIAAAAFLALVSYSKEPETANTAEYFEKGERVILAVKADDTATKVSSELGSDGKNIDFTWQSGDKIKVTVGGSTAQFTLTGGAGTGSAIFEGKMPAAGSTFDVQYPCQTPELGEQTYSSTEALPHDKMLFTATGCSTNDATISLQSQYSALRLNLYGTSQTISKIVVTNTTTSATYTLNINPAVALSTDSANPTPFFIVVPAGSYNFQAEVIDAGTVSGTPPADAIQNGVFTVGAPNNVFTTSSAKTFTAGQILNMDAKQVNTTKVYFSKGNLYYDNIVSPAAFKFESTQYAYTTGDTYDANHVCRFRWAENSGTLANDIASAISTDESLSCSTTDVFFTNATETTPRTDFTVAGQTGVWRTLSGGSGGEWEYLLNTRVVTVGGESKTPYGEGTVNGVNGLIILPDSWDGSVCSGFTYGPSSWSNTFTESTDPKWSAMENAGCVFLPAAGIRSVSSLDLVGSGSYWSSSPFSSDAHAAYGLYFDSGDVLPARHNARSFGRSVRLVSAAQ